MTRIHISKRMRALTGVLLASALALTACGGSDSDDDGTSTPGATSSGPAAVQGGSLTILEGGDIASWDPKTTVGTLPGVGTDRFNAVYGQLIYTDADGTVQGGMAKSITTDDGGATWILTMRDGVTFTDGTAYDATAVKYNWDRIAAADSGAVAQTLASSFTSEVTDPMTLTIKPSTPDPIFALRAAELLQSIASPKSLEGAGDDYRPVGAGPFLLDNWDVGVSETFKRNPDYWDTGKPYLDELTMSIVADPAQRVTSVVQGSAGIMNGYIFQFRKESESPGVAVTQVPAGGLRTMMFNTENGPLSDVRARQAISLAMDPTEFVQTLTQDPSYKGANTLFPDTSPYYDTSLEIPGQDIAKAQSLADEVVADGTDFTVDVLYPSIPELTRAAEYVQSALSKVNGITVNLKPIEIADWRAAADSGDYDITFYPGVVDLNGAEVTMTGLLGTGGADNIPNYSSTDMDAALQAARTATSDADKVAAFKSIQQIYLQDMPFYVFGIDYRDFFHSSNVAGLVPVGRGNLRLEELNVTS